MWVKDDRMLVLAVNLGDEPAQAELHSSVPVREIRWHSHGENGLTFTAQPRQLYFIELRRF